MASLSIPNSFSNGTAADAVQVNANFNAIKSYVEASLVQTDGSVKATTASLDDAIVTTAKLATGAVTEAKLAAGAVTDAKASLTPSSGVVKVYASTTARDTAITSPTAGMVVYVDSGDSSEGLYTYHGSAWRKGPGWNAPWGVVNFKSSTTNDSFTSTEKAIFTSDSFTAVSNRLYEISYYDPKLVNPDNVMTIRFRTGSTSGTVLQSAVISNFIEGSGVLRTITSSLSGSVSILVTGYAATGTSSITRSSSSVGHLVIKDIGPAGAPA